MCGIVGAWREGSDLTQAVSAGRDRLRHRGPDDSGLWCDPAAGIAFGHTRLAILDLSAAGHQPMASDCGRFHLIFNGEIYNHQELREKLPGEIWRGHSDTETLLAAFRRWGVERTLGVAVGMFALALFDSAQRTLYLARDRFGEKPLYYGYTGGVFAFASELKAMRPMPDFTGAIDSGALRQYLQLGYIPAPASIYRGILKLPMGSWLELSARTVAAKNLPAPRSYWSAREIACAGDREPLDLGEQEAVDRLEQVLGAAVRGQVIADVPLGAFLSGGIDSSTIVALMQAASSRRVRTFSIGFGIGDFDESRQAREVARHLGTDHTELIARPEDLPGLVERLPWSYDEPFADSSQLPTSLLTQLARPHVTVALSGDGGDELFGGYNRHLMAGVWQKLSAVPQSARAALASALQAVDHRVWDRIALLYARLAPSTHRIRLLEEKLLRSAELVGSAGEAALYRNLISRRWTDWPLMGEPDPVSLPAPQLPSLSSLQHRMMLADTIGYLTDDILVKVDRASMAVSLETRIPLLDHRVFEFAWRLPLTMKIRGRTSKWLLRQLLYRYVPKKLVDRPKMGFAVPLAEWLRGPFRGWAEDLLQVERLKESGLDPERVRSVWKEHLSGHRQWQHHLWNVLMLQAWMASERSSAAACVAPGEQRTPHRPAALPLALR